MDIGLITRGWINATFFGIISTLYLNRERGVEINEMLSLLQLLLYTSRYSTFVSTYITSQVTKLWCGIKEEKLGEKNLE